MLTQALKDLAAWRRYFAQADIPVLKRTALELDTLRADLDTVNAQEIADTVMRDPLMTLRVLAHMSTHKSRRQLTDIDTIEATIVMMGLPPFFAAFNAMPIVEQELRDHPQAHVGLMRVLTRAFRAASFARDWAVRRMDLDVEVIIVATLLHDLAEMLLWCFAPTLALEIRELQRSNPGLRSVVAQRAVLGIELNDLQLALMQEWRLPQLLVRMMDDKHADHPQVRNVVYAVNLARHSAAGWNDPALPDDYRAIAELLHSTPQHVQSMVQPGAAQQAEENQNERAVTDR